MMLLPPSCKTVQVMHTFLPSHMFRLILGVLGLPKYGDKGIENISKQI